jgi:ATP-binding cassette subfamily C protein CydD
LDKRLWAEARKHRLWLYGTITLDTTAGVIVIIQAALIARIINFAFLGKQPFDELMIWFGALGVLILTRTVLVWGSSFAASELAIRVEHSLRLRLTEHIAALGPSFTTDERSGELTNVLTEGIESLKGYFREYLPAVFAALLIPVIFLVVILPIDGLTFVILLLTAPLIPFFMALIGMAAGTLARTQYGELSLLSAHFLDVMQGLPTLKLFNRSAYQVQTIAHIANQFRVATMNVLRVAFLSSFTLELLGTLSVAIVAVEIGLRLINGGMGFESALFLLILAPDYYQPLRTLGTRFHNSTESKAAADRVFKILDTPLPAKNRDQPLLSDLTIRLADLSYAYGDRVVLKAINFEIRPGEHIAIVGSNGSGKSTLASLLLRFLEPTSGVITVGRIDLQMLDLAHWRQQIAWVGQNPYLFNTTIAANIQMGNSVTSPKDMKKAAALAQAHEFIAQLPQGYDTICGERGSRLSGGQAQRIALARAFHRDTPILLLDEATAQLDPATEAMISTAIDSMRDKTVIQIAHRLRTVTNATRIIVLENGQIVEEGTHNDLMSRAGVYRHLVEQDKREEQYDVLG